MVLPSSFLQSSVPQALPSLPTPTPAPSGGMLHRESLPEIQEQQVTRVPVLRAGFPN